MKKPEEIVNKLNTWAGCIGKKVFIFTFITGILTHIPAFVSDIPNHDGLASMYSSQNMITSGRWFLSIACGISSFYSLPWIIGLLSVLYIALTAVLMVKILDIKSPIIAYIVGGLMATFPALASNFAYLFTMDGYMLGMLLSVLSVYLVDKGRFGFIIGGISLAFSMGIYQAYLPIAMLLSLYMVLLIFAGEKKLSDKFISSARYLEMGVLGVVLYYILLKVLLLIEGRALSNYQGASDMGSLSLGTLLASIKQCYIDFVTFTVKGKVFITNPVATAAIIAVTLMFVACLALNIRTLKLYKKPGFYILTIITVIAVPVFANIILIIMPSVNYHMLMRYQWVLFLIVMVAYIGRFLNANTEKSSTGTWYNLLLWVTVVSGLITVFNYALIDNIAYSNMQKKYEKTYAYCLRLADRIEQTEGYYQGIPIYMIGVVGNDNFPVTDITSEVTDHIIGASGDYLLYTGENYEYFYSNYMGITFNFLRPWEANYYYEDWYVDMPSFPENGSVKVVDGILFVKTENWNRD